MPVTLAMQTSSAVLYEEKVTLTLTLTLPVLNILINLLMRI